MKILLTILIVLSFTITVEGAVISSLSGITINNWNDGANWSGGVAPGLGDDAILNNNTTVNLNVNISVTSITLNQSASLSVASGTTLTLTGNLIMNGQDSRIDIFGDVTAKNYTSTALRAVLNIGSTGTLLLTTTDTVGDPIATGGNENDVIVSGSFTANNNFTLGTNDATFVLNSTGIFCLGGTFTLGFNDVSVTIDGSFKVDGLTSNNQGSKITVLDDGVLTVDGNINISDSELEIQSGGEASVTGDVSLTNALGVIDVQAGGKLEVEGNFTDDNFAMALVDPSGFLSVDGTVVSDDLAANSSCFDSSGTLLCGDVSLPIELLSFSCHEQDAALFLLWSTASELNNDFFTIERSFDGVDFSQEAIIEGAGNSDVVLNYRYELPNPPIGVSYYRLRQTDFDGTEEVVGLLRNEYIGGGSSAFYPNPTTGVINFGNIATPKLLIYSALGALIAEAPVQFGQQSLDLTALGLESGVYFIGFQNGTVRQRLLLVN